MRKTLKITFLTATLILVLAPSAALLTRHIPLKAFSDFGSLGLYGQTISAKTPTFDSSSIVAGRTQTELSAWLAERMGRPREFFIRLNNSLEYMVGRTANPNILVGKNHELYTAEMIRNFCIPPATTTFVDDMANGLKRSQDYLAGKGKAFVFVVSPNKAAIDPTNAPSYCQPVTTDRDYTVLMAALAKAGVYHVNTEVLARRSTSSGAPAWFGKYGQHWNDIGQYYATQDILDKLRSQRKTGIAALKIDRTWTDDQPLGDEADTGLLANFLFPLRSISPHLDISLTDNKTKIHPLMVGTSFSGGLIMTMLKAGLASEVVLHNYFKWVFRYRSATAPAVASTVDASEDLLSTLLEVDTVIVEVNASALNAPHVFNFIKAMDRL